jgi:hypothetical protein
MSWVEVEICKEPEDGKKTLQVHLRLPEISVQKPQELPPIATKSHSEI